MPQAQGMETRLATGAAVGTDQQKCANDVPQTDWPRRADLDCATLKTLRDVTASKNRNHKEADSD
jgi:hypothetical protein